jgi:Flp pilus assembly pilin Flp
LGEESQVTVLLRQLWQEEDGQDLTEYAFLIVLLTLAAVSMMRQLAGAIAAVFANLAVNLPAST